MAIQGSRVRQQRKQPSGLLALQLKVADRLVFSTVRERLGGRIRFFVSGSAALSREVAEWFDAVGMPILEGYGLTETSAGFARQPASTTPASAPSARRCPGSEAKIAEDGEILLRGGGIMRGYHNQPEATAEVLTEDGWLHSGDIGEIVDGYLQDHRPEEGPDQDLGRQVRCAAEGRGPVQGRSARTPSHIVVHGEGRKFASALITLDPDIIVDWAASSHGMEGRSIAELSKEPAVVDLIEDHVQQLNGKLERWETIKKFVILDHELTIEDGELTPSMKVRRKAVEKRYLADLDKLYVD